MKYYTIFFLTIILSFLLIKNVLAQSTNENSLKPLLEDIAFICNNEVDEKYDLVIDYSIEILKHNPSSLDAYYSLYWLSDIETNDTVAAKLKKLKDEFYPTINNFEHSQAQKIVLISQYLGSEIKNTKESELIQKEVVDILDKIKINYPDNEYTPIIIILLSLLDKTNEFEHLQFFKDKYPLHPMISIIDLNIAGSHFQNNDYPNCIETLEKSIELYNNIITPYGWKLAMDYYNLFALCYIEMNDFDKANKYIKLIENEAPQYHKIEILKKWANKN